jgi:hypothetical protein
MSNIQLSARNAGLPEIMEILKDQRARRLDLIVNAGAVSAMDGNLVIEDRPETQIMDEDGVTRAAGAYRPTAICDELLGSKLGIPGSYLKDLRAARPDLWDANVNGMLHGGTSALAPAPDFRFPGVSGKYLLRLLRGDDAQTGVARAFLSPRYKFIDNLDVLLAVMDGIREAGITAVPDTCDLSDRRMFARFVAPEIAALAPKLLDGYRSPLDGPGGVARAGGDRPGMRMQVGGGGSWTVPAALAAAAREGQGYEPGKEPVVWAGLVVSNSDTGGGARMIAPQIRIKLCKNGLTLVAEADRKIHLGGEMAEGVVEWSTETQEQELKLITAQAKDAVRLFLSQDYLNGQVAAIEALAGVPVAEPDVTVKAVAKGAGFTAAEADGILAHFLRGGSYTAGGVANAVTSFSQTIASPDRAAELDRKAVPAMKLAAAAAR